MQVSSTTRVTLAALALACWTTAAHAHTARITGTRNGSDARSCPSVRLRRGHSLQFRTEFFNLFNRVNLGNPVNNVSAPNFGQIISAGSPRVIQLALKYSL